MYRRALVLVLIGGLALLAAGCGSAPAVKGGNPAPGQAPVYAVDAAAGQIALLGAGGQVTRTLPLGTPSRNWDTLYVATPGATSTRVVALAPASGTVLRATTVAGRWTLPAIGLARVPDGLSDDGSTLVLQQLGGTHAASRFAVLNSTLRTPARVLSLHGWFEYDAVSPEGATLYLIEHLASNDLTRYRVRSYDVSAQQINEGIIVDKRELDEASMQGLPNTRVSDGTWAYTLYRSAKGPFIHALNLEQGFAVCIDLPAGARSADRTARLWSLAYDERGSSLYAVNTALGMVVRVRVDEANPFDYKVTTGTFAPAPAAAGIATEAGVGSVTLTSDGSLLLAGGAGGLSAIRTADLTLAGHYLSSWTFDGLAASPDGSRLYGLSRSKAAIVSIDPRSGATLGQRTVPGATQLLRAAG